jgi:tetratricopeptide (TPR) repeat protein
VPEPALTDDITAAGLDAEVRRDLRGLQRDTADTVARHLVAAGRLVDEDPERALEHARFARARASRIAVVREAAGIAAYHAGEWAEALSELRAARRMGGGHGHLAVMADIERALGRPERALELSRGPEVRELEQAESIELAIVAAGARRDLGELDAAVVSLQIPELDPARRDPWSARLFYAYADNLLAAGRESDALQWFVHAADADDDGETDAARRIAELTGEPLPDDDFAFDTEDESPAGPNDAGAAPSDTDESDAASPESAGSTTDGMEPGDRDVSDAADSGAAVSEVAVSEVADSEVADSEAADSEVTVTGSTGAGSTGAESIGAESTGAESAGAESAGADTADVDAVGGQAHAAEAAGSSTALDSTAPDPAAPDPAQPDDASGPGQPDRGAADEREPGASG